MNSAILITEGDADTILLRALLEDDAPSHVQYIAAGGWSSADSLARSYLTDPTTKVVIVVDADSSEPNVIEERKRFLRQSLGQIAPGNRYHVLVVAPEIESLLFEDRSALESLIQHKISDLDLVRGQYEPKKMLAQITNQDQDEIYTRLPQINLDSVRNRADIQDVRRFLGIKRRKTAA